MARRPVRHDIDAVLAAVTARTGVSADEMAERGPSGDRYRPRVRVARHVLYWLAYRANGGALSLARIAARIGRTWHAARHGVQAIDRGRDADPGLRRLTDELRAELAAAHAQNPQQPARRTPCPTAQPMPSSPSSSPLP